MPLPVTYSDFLNQNGALVNDGGPWTFTRSSGDVNCGTSEREWCSDVPHCLECWVFPSASLSAYTVTFSVNISVPMNQYGNADSLDYESSYQVDWASDSTTRGTILKSTSTVGTDSFSNNFPADDHSELMDTRQTWVGDPFRHSGKTAVVQNGDRTGYISLSVGLTFPKEKAPYINYYMKGYKFKITTPTSVVEIPAASTPNSSSPSLSPVSTSSASISLSSASTTSLSSSLPHTSAPDANTSQSSDSGGGGSVTSSSSSDVPAPSSKVSTAAIVGGVMGTVAFLSALVFFFLLYRRQGRRREEGQEKAMFRDADGQIVWVSPNPKPNTLPEPMPTTNSDGPFNQHGINSFVTHSRPPNPSGYAFDYGNGGGETRGDGPPYPQNSTSHWVQNQSNTQSKYHIASNAYGGINNYLRALSDVGTTLTGTGTEAPPPTYIAPSALGISFPPLSTLQISGAPRPLPSPSVLESESQLGTSSTSSGHNLIATSTSLSQWARENRSYITGKLEMKLNAAGYVPSDDPDNIDEEKWRREWGVTKLELTRMRLLYARMQG
ncbi:hypothetical protein FRC18_004333 [Serendipita sp. 400]|nr:hypothetical protein FRC18_004333 [Serendipita sp. 400]